MQQQIDLASVMLRKKTERRAHINILYDTNLHKVQNHAK